MRLKIKEARGQGRWLSGLLVAVMVLCCQTGFCASLYFDGKYIPTESGTIDFTDHPLMIDVPDDMEFIDGEEARWMLIRMGNSYESVRYIIGMLLPEDAEQSGENFKGYVITYKHPGHIETPDASSIDLKKLIENSKSSHPSIKRTSWAWTPKFDESRHILHLPMSIFVEDSGLDYEALSFEMMFFGDRDMVTLSAIGDIADKNWFQVTADELSGAIRFKDGHTYADHTFLKGEKYYKTLSSFFTGQLSTWRSASGGKTKEVRPFIMPGVGRGWWIAFIALGALSLILYLLAAFGKTDDPDLRRRIVKKSHNVSVRIWFFFSVYVLLLFSTVFILFYGIKILINLWDTGNGFWVCALIMVLVLFLLMGVTLIASLFRVKKDNGGRVEITRSQAAPLFELIESAAREAGSEMPRHVYVTSLPNASVSPDESLSNIFGKKGKNLTLGLGLLYFINKSELKSILAHEFGHFKQDETKSGSSVAATYSVVDNIIHGNVFGENFGCFVGGLMAPVAILFSVKILGRTFVFVQKGFSSLGQDMEFEADRMAANIAGPEAALSALNKLDVLYDRSNVYHQLLNSIANEDHKRPQSYWNGYEAYLKLSSKHDGYDISAAKLELSPLGSMVKSQIELENIWITHPPKEERLKHIKAMNYPQKEIDYSRAIELVPSGVFEEVSKFLYEGTSFESLQPVSDEEYKEMIAVKLKIYTFPLYLRPYFIGRIPFFSLNSIEPQEFKEEELFNDENRRATEEYSQAVEDYNLMEAFAQGKLSHKRMRFNNVVYKTSEIPYLQQQTTVKRLEASVCGIYKNICRYAVTKAEDKDFILRSYDDVFYAQHKMDSLQDLLTQRNNLAYFLRNKGGETSESQLMEIRQRLQEFDIYLKQFIRGIEMERLYPVISRAAYDDIQNFVADDDRFSYSVIGGDEIKLVLSMPDTIETVLDSLLFYSKKKITDILEGNKPVVYWQDSMLDTNSHPDGQQKNEE